MRLAEIIIRSKIAKITAGSLRCRIIESIGHCQTFTNSRCLWGYCGNEGATYWRSIHRATWERQRPWEARTNAQWQSIITKARRRRGALTTRDSSETIWHLVMFSCLERVPRFKSQPDTVSFLSLSLWVLFWICNVPVLHTCTAVWLVSIIQLFQLLIISIDSSINITALQNTIG